MSPFQSPDAVGPGMATKGHGEDLSSSSDLQAFLGVLWFIRWTLSSDSKL